MTDGVRDMSGSGTAAPLEAGLRTVGRCDLLPYRLRKQLIRAYCDYRTVGSRPFRTSFDGLCYSGNLNSFIDWSVYFFGGYEKHILAFMKGIATVRPGCVFVDVGANVGQHSLYMSRYVQHVHAVEPWGEALATLRRQLADNHCDNVTVHEFALGAASGWGQYYPPAGGNRGVGSFVQAASADRLVQPLTYPIRRGADFIRDEVGRFDLVKIDTEGFEAQVLQGLREALVQNRPCAVVELSHGTDASFSDLAALRQALPDDYRLFGIRGVHNGFVFRLCELTVANWKNFLDVVALPAENVGAFAGAIREEPFYSRPSDLPKLALGAIKRVFRGPQN